jgi:hypothetical protein
MKEGSLQLEREVDSRLVDNQVPLFGRQVKGFKTYGNSAVL